MDINNWKGDKLFNIMLMHNIKCIEDSIIFIEKFLENYKLVFYKKTYYVNIKKFNIKNINIYKQLNLNIDYKIKIEQSYKKQDMVCAFLKYKEKIINCKTDNFETYLKTNYNSIPKSFIYLSIIGVLNLYRLLSKEHITSQLKQEISYLLVWVFNTMKNI
jgi:hypothetical protein